MSGLAQYGISNIKKEITETEKHLESIRRRGYSILKNAVSKKLISNLTNSLEKIYKEQEIEFGKESLKSINETDLVRVPFAYDDAFLDLLINDQVREIVRKILGDNHILHLQNGILNRPNKEHHQSSWHRDIPYQHYTLSHPISISALYCLSPFNRKTGGTILLPYSHKEDEFPSEYFSEENKILPELDAGDVIIFDSWVYHKAGYNSSKNVRYAVNSVFTLPILKQQIDLPEFLKEKYAQDEKLKRLLGFTFSVPSSVKEFRDRRLAKTKSK